MNRRKAVFERQKNKKKTHGSSEGKEKEKKIIKTQSEIEKELNIRSYSEYRVKDDDTMIDYEDEDIETKMIRLVILKRKGGNVKENINLVKKKVNKNELPSKLPKINKGLSILENIDINRKVKKVFIKLRAKSISMHTKRITIIFFQKLTKYIEKIYLKKYYNNLILFCRNYLKYKESINKSKIHSVYATPSPQASKKKIKNFKIHNNKSIKVELMTKKNVIPKKVGVDIVLEKIEKKKEMEKLKQQTNISSNNIINEKLKKLDSLKRKEKEYLLKIKEQKKKLQNEINLFRKKTNLSEEGISQIKKINQSEIDSSFFSEQSKKEYDSSNLKNTPKNKNTGLLSEVLSSNDINSITSSEDKVIKISNFNKNNEDNLYSDKSESKKTNSKKEINMDYLRKSVKTLPKRNLDSVESRNLRISVKQGDLNFKQKHIEQEPLFILSKNPEIIESNKEIISHEEELENEETEKEEEESINDYFIKLQNESDKDEDIYLKKKNLVEYDLFYKEQFFKNDVFKYDVYNLKDKEVEMIDKEISKSNIKKKIIEKKKLKEVMELKGLDTKELQEELNELNEKYKDIKKVEEEKIVLNIDTTEEFYNKGKLLNIYFQKKNRMNRPTFALESSEEIGAKEVIDFKPLRKEEASRRYFDDCICLEERKKINKILLHWRYICKFFVDNWIFDNFSLLMIITNSILMFISDPTDQNNYGNITDNYFLIFYGLEAILKIITFTLYSAEDAYLKDYWNILDFSVVIIGVISLIIEKSIGGGAKLSGLSALKAFRILRPFKTVKRFKNLKKCVMALIASIGHLGETVTVLFCFFLFFAVAGLQMWQGLFYRRCMNVNYGYFVDVKNSKYMCSFDSNCDTLNRYGLTFICAKGYRNPDLGAINFDNIGSSLITIFVAVTLEGWTYIFTYVSKTFKDKIFINPIIVFMYFHVFIYFGSYYLINLFLAVTNSEFEHIEKDRDKLTDKKSFFELIQSKYDIKEKQKKEKKEREKQLKNQNNKKSDETLKELYVKVNEEAFHIRKNKRDIPKVYSTVKDIYIMANNNPEELYREKLRIENEEKSLRADIERQQEEINRLIKEKKIEMDKSKTLKKNNNKIKINKNIAKKELNKTEDNKMLDRYKTSGVKLTTNNIDGLESFDDAKSNSPNKHQNNLIQDSGFEISDIIKIKNKINFDLIELSIDNTDKFFKERRANLDNKYKIYKEEKNKITKDIEKQNKNKNIIDISYFEETDFEKKLKKNEKEKNIIEKRKKQKITDQNTSYLNKNLKNRSSKKIEIYKMNRNTVPDIGQNEGLLINQELSFIDDLSLSDLSESSESKSNDITKLKYKRGHTNIHSTNNIYLSKLLMDDYTNNLDNLSYEEDLNNNNLFGFDKYRKKIKNSVDNEIYSPNNRKNSFNSNSENIINEKNYYELRNDINVKSRFKKPHSILNNIMKYEDDQKFNEENIKFNLNKYLKKEVEKDNDFLNKDRRKSFLGFLEYAQFQKELKELDDLIKNNSNNKEEDENVSDSFNNNNLHFLSEDSYLSRKDNISLEDIDVLPSNLINEKIYENEYLIQENIKKNVDSNKLTQKIRAEVFDRQSINTNIHLTSNELRNYYKESNKKLDEQLYSNKRKIRTRKDINLNVSGIIKEKNYNKTLKTLDNDEQDLNEEKNEEKFEDNNENINKNDNINNPLLNNVLSSEIDIDNSKQNLRKSIGENNKLAGKRVSTTNQNLLDYQYMDKSEKNSDFPMLNKQKTMKILNLKVSKNMQSKESDKFGLKFNIPNKSINRSSYPNKNDKTINIYASTYHNQNSIKNSNYNNEKEKKNNFTFKAKSIEKNIDKYPTENSNKYEVKEENKKYTDPLTVKQENIPDNLRGTKYYMNYLYNIIDKDLKVKDNFNVGHWEDEILGKRTRFIKIKPLPEKLEAFFVFNDKKLKLKRYKYVYYNNDKKIEDENENDLSILTVNLKYLPLNVLALISKRLRDFGKYTMKKDINQGALSFKPDSNFLNTLSTRATTNNQLNYYKSRSGRTTSNKYRNKGTLIMSSSFVDNNQVQYEVRTRKNVNEKINNKIMRFNYLTLSHYFLKESNLYYKFLDKKRKEEILNNIKDNNRKKYNRLNVKNEIENILLFDIKTNSKRYIKWSGEDVLCHADIDEYKNKWDKLINSLEDFNIIIWNERSYIKNIQIVRRAFYELVKDDYFDYVILSVVIINSGFLAIDGNFLRPEILNNLNITNYIFNGIFIFEYIVKFIGLTPLVYYSDAFTYLDTIIICFAIVDMVSPTNNDADVGAKKSVSSQLSFLRVFRITRIVRLAKILRRLKKMRFIIVCMQKALRSIYYIIIILIMFILIFELLGMSLLNSNEHYQSFLEGFYTTYQILTLENWDGIFIQLWPLNHLCIFYFVIWIFLGNYIIFNLFISILLQSFAENEKKKDEDDLTEDEYIEKLYALPDYLFSIKTGIKVSDSEKIHIEKKKNNANNNEMINNILNESNNFTSSKDALTKYSSSLININNSQININSDDEEEETEKKNNFFFSQSSDKFEEEDYNNTRNYTGIEKKRREWQKINKLFKNNESEFFVPQDNRFRIFSMKLINNKWFDYFILLTIILSTIRLIVDTFINGFNFVLLFDICDAIFNIIFLIEAALKICALGFSIDEGSYLQDNWNKIDALIVLCSFCEFQNLFQKYIMNTNNTSSIEFLKVLRLLRTLRPLRFISHNVQLKLIITSLFDSISQIINVLIILVVVLFMFSIVGISLFYSNYHDCYILKEDDQFNLAISSFNNLLAEYDVNNDITSISKFCADRYNGIMDTGPSFKFTNLKTSIITSYILSTMEGWADIMNSYRMYSDFYGFYFVGFNLIVSYFFLNLFTGIMFNYFTSAYKREQKISKRDKKAPKYYDFLRQIIDAESNYIIWNKPMKGTIKSYLREIVDSEAFENCIMAIIFLNMITMCLSYDGNSEKWYNFLRSLNYLFIFIFIFECLLKLLAYGIKPYFHISWNKFDFTLIIVSIIDWIVAGIDGIDATFLKTFQIIRVLKVLRVSRVIRLVKALKGLEKLIQTLQWSFSTLINVLCLIIITYCILALMGCYLYDGDSYEKNKEKYTYINEYYNMDNFYYSYLLIFRCATGENWHNIMMELAYRDDGKAEGYSLAFFIICNFITGIILSNLLLMITLQQYDEFREKKYNPIEKFDSFLSDFNNAWNKFSTEEDEGFRIKKTLVAQFFMELNWRKLNFPEKGKLEYIKKYINDLELYYDFEDYIYYHDVIFKIIYKQMGMQIDRNNPENNLIFKTEKSLQKKINIMINKYICKRKGKSAQKQKNNFLPFNPLTAHLYYKLSFLYLKTYLNYYKNYYKDNSDLQNSENSNKHIIEASNSYNDNSGNEYDRNGSLNDSENNSNSESPSYFKSSINKDGTSIPDINDSNNNSSDNISDNNNINNNSKEENNRETLKMENNIEEVKLADIGKYKENKDIDNNSISIKENK